MVRTGVKRALIVTFSGLSAVAVVASTGAAAHAATTTVVSSANNAKLGPILVAGKTVYTLEPSKTGCTSACLKEWPPVLLPRGTKKATAGSGVDASQLGTKKFAKKGLQITYAGERLYWSAKDKKAGQVHGNVTNKWGTWSTVTAATASTTTTAAPTTTPATEAPATSPPATAAPDTSPPATSPPETAPPATAPPETQPTTPRTQPPATTSPGNGGVGF